MCVFVVYCCSFVATESNPGQAMLTIEDIFVIVGSFLKSQFSCFTLSVEAFKQFKLH